MAYAGGGNVEAAMELTEDVGLRGGEAENEVVDSLLASSDGGVHAAEGTVTGEPVEALLVFQEPHA